MATVILFRIKPNNPEELVKLREEFDAKDEKLDGTIQLPKNNTLVTDEGHLLFIKPARLDFAVACEPDEFVNLAEREVDDQ